MRWFGLALVLVAQWMLSTSAWAATVESMRIWRAPDSTRLVFDLNGPVEHRVFPLSSPDRLVIDLTNARMASGMKSLATEKTPVKQLRWAQRNGKDLRIVLDLSGNVKPRSFLLKPNASYGHRLVLDLDDQKKSSVKTVEKVTAPGASRSADVIIAIDAGHGGEDPGAIGYRGLKEKKVVLKIAKELAALLQREPGFKPVLIRTGDYYVGLRKRTQLARKANADLLVSIHADAFKNRKANGASVFAISQRGATSETARWLANSENNADLIGGVGGVSLDDKDSVLAGVLLDLSMTASLSASLNAGSEVLKEVGRVNRLHKPRVEQAAFVVLKSPDIPSILVETGFITNPRDGKNLASSSHQKKLARSIFTGVKRYFARTPPPGTYLASRKSGDRPRHVIKRGDTLSSIASRYRVTVASLRHHNNLSADVIRVGQVLQIP
ncbi:N-acetylmuramoyl-L-alanine amidase [Aestuariirhabdus sp. Z084]|uniref:N-acetylmuramoyl-L-alanine amidase n=1 Tax=Aestuariirhabdus haliotis TaxID=2918751 RepID=UPI00201B3B5F|nr:N-acetylmuramoyl-L-alanine amidase [Aestuariirhabdus haliotis]MCL6415634.1 N-acetylmuramoyl-L-alanine amidase [Aestuariirhabdus haliotis]MCL6419629.1 N-acetylmuramoyl-L-alanine amidase [Aestuariirhabdus haliotis]